MRFFVDNNLSPSVPTGLAPLGHDAVHVGDLGLAAANDEAVLARARQDNRVLISADTDFDALLASSGADKPLVLLVRRYQRRAEHLVAIILENLNVVVDDLASGALVVIGENWLRVRPLPILPRKP